LEEKNQLSYCSLVEVKKIPCGKEATRKAAIEKAAKAKQAAMNKVKSKIELKNQCQN